MKFGSSVVGRISIVGAVVATLHILGSIWWTVVALLNEYAYAGGWNTLVDYLMGGMYRDLGFFYGLIGYALGGSLLVACTVICLALIVVVIIFFYWVATGKSLLSKEE